jgi:hypothetical protein
MEWFDGTHLIRRVGNSYRLEAAMADTQGNRISEFEPVKGQSTWSECFRFVRRCERTQATEAAKAEKVLEGFQ